MDERPEERKAREFVEAFRGRCMLLRGPQTSSATRWSRTESGIS